MSGIERQQTDVMTPQELHEARSRFFPGYFVYREQPDSDLLPFFRAVVYSEEELELAWAVKPNTIRAEIVLRDPEFATTSDDRLAGRLFMSDSLRNMGAALTAFGLAVATNEPATLEVMDVDVVPNVAGMGLMSIGIWTFETARGISNAAVLEAKRRGLNVANEILTRRLKRPSAEN